MMDELKNVTYPLLNDEGMNDTASSLAFDEAVKRADDEENIKTLLDDLSEEVERIAGTAQPWMRRVLGQW